MNGKVVAPRNFPRCGACTYWGGFKEVNYDIVAYDMYEEAKCGNFQSPCNGQYVKGDHSCHQKRDI